MDVSEMSPNTDLNTTMDMDATADFSGKIGEDTLYQIGIECLKF